MKTILFPGQGSQYKGMGKTLFPHYSKKLAIASDILGYSVEELCLSDPHNQLGLTQYTQPALYVVNALSYDHYRNTEPPPDYCAGHSLGEYNALLAAGAFDFETGLNLVQKRGQLMGQATAGGMLAVLQCPFNIIAELLSGHHLTSIDIANYNTPTQTILSGPKEAITKAEALFNARGIRCIPLDVSAAFHSRYMSDAMIEFQAYLAYFDFSPLQIPVIANVTAAPYEVAHITNLLTRQIAGSVRWNDSIVALLDIAKRRGETMDFKEMGANPVLTRMIMEIQKSHA